MSRPHAKLRFVLSLAAPLVGAGTPTRMANAVPVAAEAAKPSPWDALADADKSFTQAVWLYADGDLRGALAEFRHAYALGPNFKVLYNIATVSRELGDWAGALRTFRAYLDGGAEKIPAGRRAQVERALAELTQKVGHIEIETGGGRSELVIDDQSYVANGTNLAIDVNPGHHRVRVLGANVSARVRTIDVASGEHLRLIFEPVAPAAAVRAVPAPAVKAMQNPGTPPAARPDPSLAWRP